MNKHDKHVRIYLQYVHKIFDLTNENENLQPNVKSFEKQLSFFPLGNNSAYKICNKYPVQSSCYNYICTQTQ